jgi:hypothetical protein
LEGLEAQRELGVLGHHLRSLVCWPVTPGSANRMDKHRTARTR